MHPQHDHTAHMAAHDPHAQATAHDPVCGMAIDPVRARVSGNVAGYGGKIYFFCGKGCKLEFEDGPERYLDPSYQPSM